MTTDYDVQFPVDEHRGRLIIVGTIEDFRRLERLLFCIDVIDPELNDLEVKLRREISTIIADLRDYES